ncbi:hypothetical protein [Azospirillum sp. INR13]|nr:hypothetical protein [Azospirillum sp. INR13]
MGDAAAYVGEAAADVSADAAVAHGDRLAADAAAVEAARPQGQRRRSRH